MEKIELTESEKMILEKRGFYVRKLFSGESLISMTWEVGMIFFIGLLLGAFLAILTSGIIITTFGIYFPVLNTNNGLFGVWIFCSSIIQVILFIARRLKNNFIFFYKKGFIDTSKEKSHHNISLDNSEKYGPIYLTCIAIIIIFITYQALGKLFFTLIGLYFWLSFIGIIITFALHKIYGVFHPLYAFGNLGEKIQSLTPQIEIESKKIKEELKDTLEVDYRNLHHSFDTLSHTFEKIASLVIRLEKIEHRANKGNLFDSKKYIGSLKDDILTPLSSLSTFLGEKETELREKQQELTQMRVQVQVGGDDERGTGETSHATLTSARIEPLIEEIGRQREVVNSMMIPFRGIGHS